MSDYMSGQRDYVRHTPRKCELDTCEIIFTPTDIRKRFCSPNCKQTAKYRRDNPKIKKLCAYSECGVDISHMRGNAKFCSDNCTQKNRLTPELRRKYRLSSKYGITPEKYDEMAEAQGHRCAICRRDDPGTKHGFWHIDHCHATGKLRQLLCTTCNTALGSFYDNAEWLMNAANYIRRHAESS